MRHRKRNVGLNRTASHRRALLANLAGALFTHKKIITTLPKAKAARSYAERLITKARRGDLAARRQVLKKVTDKVVVKELFNEIAPKFRDRNGGYTRIVRLDNRAGDNAPMAVLELVGFAVDDTGSKKPRRKRAPKKTETPKVEKAAAEKKAEEVVEDTVEEAVVETAAEETVETETAEAVEEAPAEEVAEEAAPEAPAEEPKAEEAPAEETPAEEPKAEAEGDKEEEKKD